MTWTTDDSAAPHPGATPTGAAARDHGADGPHAGQDRGADGPHAGTDRARLVHRAELASWRRRVGAYLLDVAVSLSPWLLAVPVAQLTAVDGRDPWSDDLAGLSTTGAWAMLAAVALQAALWIANRWVLQGRTGRSVGKRALGLRLADRVTGEAPRTGRAVGRELAHVLDGVGPLGFLWPLWDDLTQTFADKIVGTVVVRERGAA